MPHLPRNLERCLGYALAAGSVLILCASPNALAAEALAVRPLFSTTIERSGRGFLSPQGLAFDPFRFELYVADTGNSRVVVLSKSGLALHTYEHWVRDAQGEIVLGEPGALIPMPGGQLALTDRLSDRVDMLDYRGDVVRSIDVTAALGIKGRAQPGRMDRDSEENLYVVEHATSRIVVFDNRGKLVRSFGRGGKNAGEFAKIADVAVGEDGTTYVLDSTGTPAVTAFGREGEWLFGFGRHGNKAENVHLPVALAIDGAGRIWVADAFSHELKAYTAKGDHLATFGQPGDGPGELYFPSDVVAFADLLYVLEKGGRRLQAFHIETAQPSASTAGKEEPTTLRSDRELHRGVETHLDFKQEGGERRG